MATCINKIQLKFKRNLEQKI